MSADDALQSIAILRNIYVDEKMTEINTFHKYYYEIQGQLHITNRQYCLLIINTPFSMKQIRIDKDDSFWNHYMEKKLLRFYNECILDELVDPRNTRKMKIRQPKLSLLATKEQKL